MDKKAWCRVVVPVAVSLALGCGSGGPPHCDQVEPCGGDVVGAWKMLGGCFNAPGVNADFAASCPGGSITVSRLSVSGALTFNADFTYSSTAVETISAKEVIPLACLGSLVATCADLAAAATSSSLSFSCVGTSVCTCAVSGTQPFPGQSGTYTTAGTTLSTTDAVTGNSGGSEYCVQADLMHLVDVSTTMNMGPMGQATILSDFVAQKQ